MIGRFYDTVIICSTTGVVIVSSYLHYPEKFWGRGDDRLTATAFSILPSLGSFLLSIALVCFAFSTIIGWSYYGEKCMKYLFGARVILGYRIVFLVSLIFGAIANLSLIWSFSDIMNDLMVIPNLIGLLLLNGFIVKKQNTI